MNVEYRINRSDYESLIKTIAELRIANDMLKSENERLIKQVNDLLKITLKHQVKIDEKGNTNERGYYRTFF